MQPFERREAFIRFLHDRQPGLLHSTDHAGLTPHNSAKNQRIQRILAVRGGAGPAGGEGRCWPGRRCGAVLARPQLLPALPAGVLSPQTVLALGGFLPCTANEF